MNMVPKIIHYCWFGRTEKPESVRKCIASWDRVCPGYKIIEWNEDNTDLDVMPFVREAYAEKKYAFVSDVVRLLVLYDMGGVYFDTDVEVIKDITSLLASEGFIGFETDDYVASGLIFASIPRHIIIRDMIKHYEKERFLNDDGSYNLIGCPRINTEIFVRYGLVCNGTKQKVRGMDVYPREYFNPYDDATGRLKTGENTYSIHWYSKSWLSWKAIWRSKITRVFHRFFGVNCFNFLKRK